MAAVAGAARKVQNGQWGNTSTKGAGKMGKSKMSKRNQLTMFEVRGGHEAAVLRPTGQGAVVGESAGGGGGKRAKTLSLADRLASGAGGRVAEVAFSLFPAYHCFCCPHPPEQSRLAPSAHWIKFGLCDLLFPAVRATCTHVGVCATARGGGLPQREQGD